MVVVGAMISRMPTTSGASQPNAVARGSRSANAGRSAGARAAQQVNELDQSIELTRNSNGYFYADVQDQRRAGPLLVDTGATVIALSRDDAHMAGLATSIGMNDVSARARTARSRASR